jgi:hypothetical protein
MGGNIKLGLRVIRWEFMGWMHAVQNRDQWRALVNLQGPSKAGNILAS